MAVCSAGYREHCERHKHYVIGLDHLGSEERIAHFVNAPPEDTRAWGRAQLLRGGGKSNNINTNINTSIRAVDWNRIKFEDGTMIEMRDPLRFTRRETGAMERSQG